MASYDPDRLLVKDGFRHFRRTYDVGEVKWGIAVLAALVAITGWIVWKGQHPPDDLYANGPLAGGKGQASGDGDRGPVPEDLAPAGWSDRGVSSYTSDNLYEKINGRADFFLSKGFARLYAVTVTGGDDAVIDIELYDMGSPQGALAAFSAEKKEGAEVASESGAQFYRSRNALFLVKGKHYARAIGSAETPAIADAVEAMRNSLLRGLEGSDKAWAYELFESGMKVAADKVSFVARSAFSVEGLNGVWIARRDGDLELFVTATESESVAEGQRTRVLDGLAAYGKRQRAGDGAVFVVDEFLGTYSGAAVAGTLVVGVKGAADEQTARKAIAELQAAAAALSPATLDRALAEASERADSAGAEDPPPGEQEGPAADDDLEEDM